MWGKEYITICLLALGHEKSKNVEMKTLIWIIGKPGSGKTTVGSILGKTSGTKHFSYGQLLKEAQPNPSLKGYSAEDREKVNEILVLASNSHHMIVVDGNPYAKIGFGFLGQVKKFFDSVTVVHLLMTDEAALARLIDRNREVLAHDGSSQKDRVDNFNKNLLPLIVEYATTHSVFEIEVGDSAAKEVALSIMNFLATKN